MTARVSGRPTRTRLASRAALLIGLLGLVAGPIAPIAGAAGTIGLSAPYPSVVAEPGSLVTFKLALDVPTAQVVSLSASGLPTDWKHRFRGGGSVVESAWVDPKGTAPDVTFSTDVPDGAAAGVVSFTVTAKGVSGETSLTLAVRVSEAAGGNVTLAADFPELRGPSSATFNFNLTLDNQAPTESTFSFDAVGPAGWTVAVKPAGQAQATSVVVGAIATTTLTVTATPPAEIAADSYPIQVTVSGGGKTVTADLTVTITGSYSLSLSTPNQVLSARATAGTAQEFQVTVTNTGTAAVSKLTPTATPPSGWTVTFSPETLDTLEAGKTETITATITPSGDAITGDYQLSVTAKTAEAQDTMAIRVTVETPAFWWIAGVLLIGAIGAALYWVFRTYGRR